MNTLITVIIVIAVAVVCFFIGWQAKIRDIRYKAQYIFCLDCGQQVEHGRAYGWKLDPTGFIGFCPKCWDKQVRKMLLERLLSNWQGVEMWYDANRRYTAVGIPDSVLAKLGIKQEN